jgi:hypothetical protein
VRIEERPARARTHRHGHLAQAESVAEQEHERLDLGVVVRVVGAKSVIALRSSAWKPEVGSVIRCR